MTTAAEKVLWAIETLIDERITTSVQFWAQDDEGRHRDDAELDQCRDDLIKALKELEGTT